MYPELSAYNFIHPEVSVSTPFKGNSFCFVTIFKIISLMKFNVMFN